MKKNTKIAIALIIIAAVCLGVFGANLFAIYVPAENLITYEEFDPYNVLTVTNNQITATDLQKAQRPYCRNDFGISNSLLDGDFEVYLHVKITQSNSSAIIGFWMANQQASSNSLYNSSANADGLVFYLFRYTEGNPATDGHRFILYDRESTKPVQQSYVSYDINAVASTNVDYWFTITRYGLELTLKAHSDSARTNLLSQSTYILEHVTSFRYMYAACGYGYASTPASVSAIMSDYYIQEPAPYEPPIAVFTWSPTYPVINELVTFDGSQSSTDGTITNYEWDWENDGTFDYQSTSPTAQHSFSTSGSKMICLRVTDNYAQVGTVVHTINVQTSAPDTYMLTVHTKDSTGTIIPGATVTIAPGGFSQLSSNVGIAEFELEPGTYTIQVSAFGFDSWQTTVTIISSDIKAR